jgi:hypothetical protein
LNRPDRCWRRDEYRQRPCLDRRLDRNSETDSRASGASSSAKVGSRQDNLGLDQCRGVASGGDGRADRPAGQRDLAARALPATSLDRQRGSKLAGRIRTPVPTATAVVQRRGCGGRWWCAPATANPRCVARQPDTSVQNATDHRPHCPPDRTAASHYLQRRAEAVVLRKVFDRMHTQRGCWPRYAGQQPDNNGRTIEFEVCGCSHLKSVPLHCVQSQPTDGHNGFTCCLLNVRERNAAVDR